MFLVHTTALLQRFFIDSFPFLYVMRHESENLKESDNVESTQAWVDHVEVI